MKRRVRAEVRYREPGQLETGTERHAEHGLGAAHREGFPLGCDGSARDSAGVSANART